MKQEEYFFFLFVCFKLYKYLLVPIESLKI
jgi:hypothetical protein